MNPPRSPNPAAGPGRDAGVPGGSPRERWRQRGQQAETLRRLSRRLSHELARVQEILAERVPENGRPPASRAVRLPAAEFASEGLWFCLDECAPRDGHTVIRGWAFCPALDGGRTTTTLVLQGARGTYFLGVEARRREDVARAFAGHDFGGTPAVENAAAPPPVDLERVGFTCEVLNASVTPGEYELLLHLESADGAAVRRTTDARLTF